MDRAKRINNSIEQHARTVMYAILLLAIPGMLLLEYGESIILGASFLIVYAIYLYLSPAGRRHLAEGAAGLRHSWTAGALLFIVLWSLASAIWSQARVDTLGNSLLYLILLVFYLALKDDFNETRQRTGILAAFSLAIAGVMGRLIWQYAAAWSRGEGIGRDRFLSTIENSNNLGIISLMFLLFSLSMAVSCRRWILRSFYGLLSVMALAGILSSRSRSSLVVTALILCYLIWKYNPKFILGLLLLGGIVLISPELMQRFLDIFSYEHNVQRMKVWRVALMLFRESPLLGVGATAFRVGYVRIFEANPQLFNIYDIKVLWHAHNMYLRFASELGLPGLLASLGLTAGAFRMMRGLSTDLPKGSPVRIRMEGVGLAILAFFLANLIDSYWVMPKPLFVFAVLLGLAGGVATDRGLVQ